MNYDVFISASRRDYNIASEIISILQSAGYTYFYDIQSLGMGVDFEQTIKTAIKNSDFFLCILSGNAFSSDFVCQEIDFAIKEKGINNVIPIVIDNAMPLVEIERNLPGALLIRLNDMTSTKTVLLHEIEKRKKMKESLFSVHSSYSSIWKGREQNHRIFISYKRIDKDVVFKIKNKIEQQTEVPCWIDIDGIESDAQFINVIIKAINNAEIFLFMYSSSHKQIEDFENDWTIREISYAQKRKKRIVFINIDESELTDWFEMMFGTKQHVCASSEESMNRLFDDIRNWLK